MRNIFYIIIFSILLFSCKTVERKIDKLSKEGNVMVYKHEGEWECMDHERDVDHLNRLWSNKKAFWI